jgi:hypothetical protein
MSLFRRVRIKSSIIHDELPNISSADLTQRYAPKVTDEDFPISPERVGTAKMDTVVLPNVVKLRLE